MCLSKECSSTAWGHLALLLRSCPLWLALACPALLRLQVAIVGYTNTGKSSLLSALAKCGGVGVEDRLFATLDPTLRWVPALENVAGVCGYEQCGVGVSSKLVGRAAVCLAGPHAQVAGTGACVGGRFWFVGFCLLGGMGKGGWLEERAGRNAGTRTFLLVRDSLKGNTALLCVPPCRRVMLPGSGRDVILSDTVGFISELPHQLVEAFKVKHRGVYSIGCGGLWRAWVRVSPGACGTPNRRMAPCAPSLAPLSSPPRPPGSSQPPSWLRPPCRPP